ncbi:MAG: hypothetical protein IT301_12890 [Dehalococcoidia bacterium]|nr:hypothetical protein [Dehalococcoidia bacterium]
MRRKMLGAILLPIPFAALPVLVVLAGAVLGGKGAGESELVTTKTEAPAIESRVSSDSITVTNDNAPLARTTSYTNVTGCEEDLRADF